MGQNWTVPVYRGEVQGFTLGCAMEARDDSGKTMKKKREKILCLTKKNCFGFCV